MANGGVLSRTHRAKQDSVRMITLREHARWWHGLIGWRLIFPGQEDKLRSTIRSVLAPTYSKIMPGLHYVMRTSTLTKRR